MYNVIVKILSDDYAGNYLTQYKDRPNWEIENMNEVNRVDAENKNAQHSGFNVGGMLSGAANGAMIGSTAGPWGAVIGGVAGGALGGFSNYLGGNNVQAGIQGVGSTIGNYGTQNPTSGLNWLNSKMGYTIR